MPSFQVTTPNPRLKNLRPGETAEVTYSVTNVAPGTQRAIFSVKTKDAQQQSWYSIKGDPASDLAAGATRQVVVTVSPPAGAAPQDYSFSLFVGLSGQEDSDFTMGPDVTYTVTKVQPKRFPWWIVAAAVVLLAVVGGVIYAVVPKNDCISGYVWRNAFAGDHVCVVPATRDQAQADNAASPSRTRRIYQPVIRRMLLLCAAPYVWRNARPTPPDRVCVTQETQAQTAADNAAAASHRRT
jgi:hypothetical protein